MALINQVISGARSDSQFLAALSSEHEARLLDSIRSLRENITTMVSDLERTPAGKLQGVKVNLKQTQKIHKKLVTQFERDYNRSVDSMLGSFNRVDRLITRRYKSFNEAAEFSNIDKKMMDALKQNVYERYKQFGEDARDQIATAMYGSVVGGQKFSTLVNTIKGVLTGHRDVRGRPMTMYAKGFAHDSVMNYHNQVNMKKASDLGIRHFLYYGDIIATSRPFCITRVGKVYTERQINAWDGLSWTGKAGPPLSERGGYNCRHHWRAVRKKWLEDEDGKEFSRNEILGEMSAEDNIKARNLSAKIEKKRKLIGKLDGEKKLLAENEIKTLREKITKIGGEVKPRKLVVAATRPKLQVVAAKAKPGAPKIGKIQKAFVGKVKYYVKGGKSVGPKSKMFGIWDQLTDANKKYYLDLWESEGIDISKYKHLFPTGKIPKIPKIKPVPKPKVKIPAPKKPMGPKQTKAFVGKVKYYVKRGKSVGTNSKMFKIWDEMSDLDKQYYIDLWESQGIKVSGYKHLFPGAKLPKIKPVPKPKFKPKAKKWKGPKVKPVPKPKVKKPKGPTVPPTTKTQKAFVGKVKYYMKNGKSVGVKSKMFSIWDEMDDAAKQYYLDLWEDEGIDTTLAKYKHLFPGSIVKPIFKPKIIGWVAPKNAVAKKLYKDLDSRISEFNKIIDATKNPSKYDFAELIKFTERKIQLGIEIESIEAALIKMGMKARPVSVKKIKKLVAEASKELDDLIKATQVGTGGMPVQDKLFDMGIHSVVDMYEGTADEIKDFTKRVIQPIYDETDRVVSYSPTLRRLLEEYPLMDLEIVDDFSMGKYYGNDFSSANGAYWSYVKRMSVARGGRLDELEKGLMNYVKKPGKKNYQWSCSDITNKPITTYRHELGHHIHYVIEEINYGGKDNPFKIAGMPQRWNKIWDQKGNKWFRENVTTYSGKNIREAFTESFTMYTSPDYKRGWLPNIIEDYFDDFMKVDASGSVTVGPSQLHFVPISQAANLAPMNVAEALYDSVIKPTKANDYIRKKGKWYLKGKLVKGAELKRLNKLAVPPAWNQVVAAVNKKADILAMGKDGRGQWQYRRSAKATKASAIKKYTRVRLFKRDMPKIRKKIEAGIKKGDDYAYILELENKTVIRNGTDRDIVAKVKAYGLTTLQYEHVVIKGNKIILDFTAKKGIHSHYELTDARLARWLEGKKAASKKGQQLFPNITGTKLNKYLRKISGNKKYSVKDFRTYHATRIAWEDLKQYAGKSIDPKQKKAIIKEVTEKVSKFLHNTPVMAKNSYIDPMVWDFIGGL